MFNLLLVLSMVIWGGSWVSAKSVSGALSVESLSFWRFLLSALSFVPVIVLLREPIRMDRRALAYTGAGSVFAALYLFVFFKGLREGLAGASGVLVTTSIPLVTFALSAVLLGQRLRLKDLAGLALGSAGGAVLLSLWRPGVIFSGGNLYFLLGALLWALLTITSQKAGESVSPVIFSFLTTAFSAVMFFVPAMRRDITGVFHLGPVFWLNMIYLSVLSSALATTVYFLAAKRLGGHRASSFTFIVPVSAVVLSWAILGETPHPETLAGGSLAIAAVYLINSR